MAIGKRNSGFVKQDGIIAGFGKEARTAASSSNAVAQAMQGKDQRAEYAAAQARKLADSPRISFKFISTGK